MNLKLVFRGIEYGNARSNQPCDCRNADRSECKDSRHIRSSCKALSHQRIRPRRVKPGARETAKTEQTGRFWRLLRICRPPWSSRRIANSPQMHLHEVRPKTSANENSLPSRTLLGAGTSPGFSGAPRLRLLTSARCFQGNSGAGK